MIRVDSAGTRRLSLITAQNGAQCVVGGSQFTIATGAYDDLAPTCTTITSATTTSIDTAPMAGCINDYDFVNVKNTFAGSHTMTLQITSGSGGPFPLKTFALLTDESMNYAHGTGFQFFDASGNLKETLVVASNWGVTGNLTVGGNTTLGDAAADSLTINAGVFSMPNIPAFLAYKSAQSTNTTGAGTNNDYICDTEVFDQGANYNNSTGVFTAPITGRYRFTAKLLYINVSAAMTQHNLFLVTSNRSYSQQDISVPGSQVDMEQNALVDMDAGDVAFPRGNLSNGAGDTATTYGGGTLYTYFCGEQVA